MMASSGREPQVSNMCVLSSGGTLSRCTAHLTCTHRASPLEVSYSPTSLSNTIFRSVTSAGSCPKSTCMISSSCPKERACERGLSSSRCGSLTPLGCCRMICSAGPLVSMTSRYLSCASMSWFKGSRYPRVCMCCRLCCFHHMPKLEVNH